MERVPEFQSDIDTYGFQIEAPVQRTSDTAVFYFVRHGMSMYNYRAAKCKQLHGEDSPEFHANMKDPTLFDPDLHPLGVAQAEFNAPKVHALNCRYVLVSPMQRAMQTAIHMFKGHPNLSNIRFVVEPMVHEIMHTTNDMNMDVLELIQKYAPGQAACHGCVFDFSNITNMERPQLWNINTMATQSVKDAFFEKLSQLEGGATYANVKAVNLEMMIAELPYGAFENKAMLYERGQKVKQVVKNFLAAHPVEGDEKIPIVCHS